MYSDENTLRRVIELKREKRPTMIGFISDQLPKWNSMHFFVPFLHRETAVFTGAEQIGRQVKAVYFLPISFVPAEVIMSVRSDGWRYRR